MASKTSGVVSVTEPPQSLSDFTLSPALLEQYVMMRVRTGR